MDKFAKRATRDVTKNIGNSIKQNKFDLAKKLSSKTSSDATTQQNEGQDITSAKTSEPDSARSKLERLRKDFHGNNTSTERTMASETLKAYQDHSRQLEQKDQGLDPILSAEEHNKLYPPSSPAPFNPRLRSLLETSKTLPEQTPKPVKDANTPSSILDDPRYRPGSPAAFDPRLRS